MSDGLFHAIDGAFVVLRCKGVYRQAQLYARDERVYAKWGSGFIRLSRAGGTTHPNATWDDLVPLDARLRLCNKKMYVEYAPQEPKDGGEQHLRLVAGNDTSTV